MTYSLTIGSLALVLLAAPGGAQTRNADSTSITYLEQVRPILAANCYRCHADDDEPKGALFLDTYEDVIKGGKHGTTVRPGRPDSSSLYLKLFSDPPFGKRMPARRDDPLSGAEIETIRQWILQGALKGRSPAGKF
jgi:mono/diheme cytochrome c family protein